MSKISGEGEGRMRQKKRGGERAQQVPKERGVGGGNLETRNTIQRRAS